MPRNTLHGEGAHFSAGLDLSELTERDAVQGLMHSRMWHRALDSVQFGKAPVIAALHGAVIGGGLELACAAHIRVAEPSAYYALPEGQRGIFVGGGGSARVPRLAGVHTMTDMMLTGRVLDAHEGERRGLSQYVVANGADFAKGCELAAKIAGNAPLAVQSSKRMMRMGMDETFNDHVHHVFLQLLPLFQSEDFKEGMASFLEKRKPEFKGR